MNVHNRLEDPINAALVPVALLTGIMLALLFLSDPFQLVLPVAAFGCGYLLRPRRLWPIWLATLILFELALLIMWLVGYTPPKVPVEDATVTLGSFLFDIVLYGVYLAVGAMVPLWLGRYLAERRARA